MNENTFELGPTDICKFIKTFAGNKFIYSKNFKLFCFNGKFWEQNNIEFRKYISGELYNFLKLVLVECFWNNREFNSLKSKLEKFKTISLKKELEETYKEYGLNETIKFDDKWFLFDSIILFMIYRNNNFENILMMIMSLLLVDMIGENLLKKN